MDDLFALLEQQNEHRAMTIVLLVSSSSYLKAKRRTTTSNLPQSFSFVGREKKNEEAADKYTWVK